MKRTVTPAVTMHCEQFEDLFVLECSGKTRKLKESYLTPTCIGKVFNLFPDSIILIAADDGTIEVPDELGFFSGLKTYRTYEVQGESMEMKTVLEKGGECSSSFGSPAVHSHTSKMSSSAGPSRASSSLFAGGKRKSSSRSQAAAGGYKHKGPLLCNSVKPPGVISQETDLRYFDQIHWRKNIEICDYVCGRLKKNSNFPMSLTNETAKVEFIAESISQELFSGEDVVLVDADSLQIRDSTVTRGKLQYISHTDRCVNIFM